MNNKKRTWYGESKIGLICSVIFHIFFVILMYSGVSITKKEVQDNKLMILDVVSISDITNIAVKNSNVEVENEHGIEQKQNAIQKESELPSKQAVSESSQIEKSDEVKIKKEEPKIERSKPNSISEPVPIKKGDEVKIKKEEPKIEKSKPNSISESKTETAKKKKSVERDVKKEKNSQITKKIDNGFADLEKLIEGSIDHDFDENADISMSEIDAIKNQIKRSWNPIAFNGRSESMKVTLHITLDQQGVVLKVKPLDYYNKSDQSYAAFVDSVVRAVHKASPLEGLSQNKYYIWKELEVNFSSEEMM